MADRLKMDAINSLQHPLSAVFFSGNQWPVLTIDVETGLMHIDICGLPECKRFCEVSKLIDGDYNEHDAEQFWIDV